MGFILMLGSGPPISSLMTNTGVLKIVFSTFVSFIVLMASKYDSEKMIKVVSTVYTLLSR